MPNLITSALAPLATRFRGGARPQGRILVNHLTHQPFPYIQPGLVLLSVLAFAVAIPPVFGL